MNGRWCATVGLLAGSLAGCVTGSYDHATYDEPLSAVVLEGLRPGHDDLATCLGALGAPHRVFEYRKGDNAPCGAALLWFWRDSSGFGVELSGSVKDAPGSVSLELGGTDLPGCMLWFGPDLVLERWQQGLVGNLLPRSRPGAAPEG